MGDLRFTASSTQDFDPRVWNTAYITGIEGIPWQCHHKVEGDQFSIGREIDESGKLNILWPTTNFGNVCLQTTSLRLCEQVYSLPLELARGTVSRLRQQTSEWQRVGLRLPDKFFPLAEDALSQLLKGLTVADDSQRQQQAAENAINLALEAATLLCNTFAAQSLEARRLNEGRLSTLLGIQLGESQDVETYRESLSRAFNLLTVAADFGSVQTAAGKTDYDAFDAQVDWAKRNSKKVCIGPLVNFRPGKLPQWMILLDEGFESILEAACSFAKQTVERYRGKANIWNCAAGLNIPNGLEWSDEQVLRMAVSLIETVRRADDRCPVLLTVDQPWSEYLRHDADGISPLHFADALIRADLGLSGIALDLTMDTWPHGSFPRDPIEVNRLIDRWSMLGLPLMAILSSPIGNAEDAEGEDNEVAAPPDRVSSWRTSPSNKGLLTPEAMMRLLLAKPSVHAVIWNNFADQGDRSLWNGAGKAKPLLNSLAALRKVLLH